MTIRAAGRATIALLLLVAGSAGLGARQVPIHFSLSKVGTAPITPGKNFDVVIKAEIDATWHLYALAEPAGGPEATEISIAKGGVYSIGGSIVFEDPKHAFDPNFNMETPYYEEHTAFQVPVKVDAKATGKEPFKIIVHYQTCNDHLCLPPTDVELALEGPKVPGAPGTTPPGTTAPAPATGNAPRATSSAPATGNPPPATSSAPATGNPPPATRVVVDMSAATSANTLAGYVGLAALMGALSLLTPCVFPMVPITVSYFTNRAQKSRKEAVIQALVYGIGIVLTFTAVGFTLAIGFGASGLNRFAADPWLNLGVTALFLFFALNLFGLYELALPSKLVTMASKADEGKGRHIGTILMGLAFTLTSFTCTAPFLGTLLVVASQGQWQWPLAGMLAFSSVFALPFVILALVPQLLTSLPKSGGWLLSVKAVMGLLELAAAMKFLSNVDLVWNWHIFTRTVVLVSWVVVAAVLVAYLAGLLKLGHAPKLKRPGVARLAGATAFAVLAVWLSLGAKGRSVGELEAFLPPDDLMGTTTTGDLPWILNDFDTALMRAKEQHRPILIDFTGYTCTNCRWMEANMFPKPEIKRELARYVRVRLYTDGRGELFKRYQAMQQQMFGTVALPYYAALSPAGEPTVTFGGLTRNPSQYIAFLQKGLE